MEVKLIKIVNRVIVAPINLKKALIIDLFGLQLGQDIKGKTLYITVKLEMALPIGEVRQF